MSYMGSPFKVSTYLGKDTDPTWEGALRHLCNGGMLVDNMGIPLIRSLKDDIHVCSSLGDTLMVIMPLA